MSSINVVVVCKCMWMISMWSEIVEYDALHYDEMLCVYFDNIVKKG